jgi:hypothetical protein
VEDSATLSEESVDTPIFNELRRELAIQPDAPSTVPAGEPSATTAPAAEPAPAPPTTGRRRKPE